MKITWFGTASVAIETENANAICALDFDFDCVQDIYIFNPEEKWTYVVTHEKGTCGPYFCQIKD